MKEKLKRFMLSKFPELIALIFQLVGLVLIFIIKPCGVPSYFFGLLCGFIVTKIMTRISYTEKKAKQKKQDNENNS